MKKQSAVCVELGEDYTSRGTSEPAACELPVAVESSNPLLMAIPSIHPWLSGFLPTESAVEQAGGGRHARSGSRESAPTGANQEADPPAFHQEITAAMTSAMQRNPMAACFKTALASSAPAPYATSPRPAAGVRHSITSSVTTALRKRGQRAWQRAMRAGGPFAPGSVVGAVAAANHRQQILHSAAPAEPLLSIAEADSGPLASPEPSFHSAHGGGGTASIASSGMETAGSVMSDLGRPSHTLSEASSTYHSVAGGDPSSWASAPSPSGSTNHSLHQQGHARLYRSSRRQESPTSPVAAPTAGSDSRGGRFSHSSHPAVEAFHAGQLGFGFSGGGFLFPWHLGVVTELKDMGILHPSTPLAGARLVVFKIMAVASDAPQLFFPSFYAAAVQLLSPA